MIHVVIDTNILRHEGLISSNMQILQRLLNAGDVKLIIPEIVLKEYISQGEEVFETKHSEFFDTINKLKRRGSLLSWNFFINTDLDWFKIPPTLKASLGEIETNINNFFNGNGMEIYSISKTDINKLFDNYFSSEGGFSKKKSRNDFPDAVIYNSIVEILKDVDRLYFICQDGNLKRVVEKIKGVNILSSVKELLDIPLLKEKVEELDKNNKRITSILAYLSSEDCKFKISSYFEKVGIGELEKTFFIENCEKFFLVDNFYPDNISDIKVKYNKKYPDRTYAVENGNSIITASYFLGA